MIFSVKEKQEIAYLARILSGNNDEHGHLINQDQETTSSQPVPPLCGSLRNHWHTE